MLAGERLTLARLFERVGRGGTVCKGLWVESPKAARTLYVLVIPACMVVLAYLIF